MEIRVDGKGVFAATGGRTFDPSQPAVVFVHGSGMDHSVWALQTRYFSHRGRSVLAVDLPGHGRSEGSPLKAIGEIADWLAALLGMVGVSSAAFVGHSLGALAALDVAGRHPDRVRSLALLGVAGEMRVNERLLDAAANDDHAAIEMITDWSHGDEARTGGLATPGWWMSGGTTRLLERAAPGVLHADLAACHAYDDATVRAEAVRCPTVLVLGERDRMTPAAAGEALGESISAASVVVIPGAGHSMMVEYPDAVNAALASVI